MEFRLLNSDINKILDFLYPSIISFLFKIRLDNWVLILQLVVISNVAYMVGFVIMVFVSYDAHIMQVMDAETTMFYFQVCRCVDMSSYVTQKVNTVLQVKQ